MIRRCGEAVSVANRLITQIYNHAPELSTTEVKALTLRKNVELSENETETIVKKSRFLEKRGGFVIMCSKINRYQ